jgi:putative PEP-CTERM system TPR-repeat lipoprotein
MLTRGSLPLRALLLAATICCLILTTLTVGCKKQSVEELISDARHYQMQGEHKSAIIQLKNVLQQAPEHGDARYLLGTIYVETGDGQSAEKELRKALELNQEAARVRPYLARALLLRGEYQQVVDELAKVDVPSAELLSLRGQAELALGRADEAKESFNHALRLEPELADALLGQARIASAEKNLAAAATLIERALASSPKSLEGWLMKGDIARLRADNEAAKSAYLKAVEYHPDRHQARLTLASAQIASAEFDKARQQIQTVRQAARAHPMANYLLAFIEFRQKNYSAAKEALLEVLKVAPDHVPSVLLAGVVDFALGQNSQAEKHLSWVLARMPNNLYARRLLVAALLRRHEVEHALEIAEKGLGQSSEDTGLLALAAEAHMQNGNFAKATQYFQKAALLEPKNAAPRTGLGLSRLAAGETERAIDELESAAKLDTERYQADVLLIMTHLRNKAYDNALDALNGLEKKQPDNPLTHNLRAAAYLGKKDDANARKNLERALAIQPTYFPAAANLAQLDLKDNKVQEAKKRFESILAYDKNHLQAMLALAELARRTGAPKAEAVGWLEKAKKANTGSVQPHLALARVHHLSGDMKSALAAAQDARNANPENPEVLNMLGQTQLLAGEKEHAVTTYTKLVQVSHKSPAAHFQLAGAQAATGNQTAAAQSLKKALELKPDFLEAQTALVKLDVQSGRLSEAMAIAQQVQKQTPKNSAGFLLEGDVLLAEKKYAQAAKAYTTGYNLQKSAAAAVKIHHAQVLAGKPEVGMATLSKWIKENPNDVGARFYLAEQNLKSGQYSEAIDQYQRVLSQQPENVLALNNLACAYQQAKDPRALEYAERAYRLRPDNAAIADTLGWVLVERGDTRRGLELLQKASSLAPKAQEIRYHLAQAWLKSGQRDKAREELEHIQANRIKFPQEAEITVLLKQLKD